MIFEDALPDHSIDSVPAEISDILQKIITDELVEMLKAAIAALSIQCQTLLRLAYCEGKSERSIAETLGIPTGTVKSRKSRCLEKLRKLFFGTFDNGGAPGRL